MMKIDQCIITVTRACNLRCSFCYAKKTGYKADEVMDFTSLTRLIDFCSDAGVKFIVLTGGEPLLYPHILEALRCIKSRPHAMAAAIPTNGILLSDEKFCRKVIGCGLDYIDISLKGKDSQEWLRITESDGFSRQMRAINNLSQLSGSGMEFTCSMVITPANVGTFCEAVEYAYLAGGRKFSFTFVVDNDQDGERGRKYLEANNPLRLVDKFLSQADILDQITAGEWWVEYSFPECVYSQKQKAQLHGRLAKPCHVHKGGSLTFDTGLNLIPCSMFIDEVLGKFGTDFSSLPELECYAQSPKYESIITSLNMLPSGECDSCDNKASCLGGCPCFWQHCTFEEFTNFRRDALTC